MAEGPGILFSNILENLCLHSWFKVDVDLKWEHVHGFWILVAFHSLLEMLTYFFKFPDGEALIFLDKTYSYRVTVSVQSPNKGKAAYSNMRITGLTIIK